jgi:hypothetical protein
MQILYYENMKYKDEKHTYTKLKMATNNLLKLKLKYNEEMRDWKPEVRWFYGSSDSEKTQAAKDWLGDNIYTVTNNDKFWDGYDAHENVLIDDINKDFAKFNQMSGILDRYNCRVEIRRSSRQFLAKKIAITSLYSPQTLYMGREDKEQIMRRIDSIILISNISRQKATRTKG